VLAQEDNSAREIFEDFGGNLGLGIRQALSEFAPGVVVLGGGISRAADLFLPATYRELDGLAMRIEVSTLVDNAALVGAAVEWFGSGNGGAQ
jgi:glucokinase